MHYISPLLANYTKGLLFSVLVLCNYSLANENTQIISSIEYVAKAKMFSGRAKRTLEKLENGNYKLSNNLRVSIGTVKEHSIFYYDEAGKIVPIRYEYRLRALFFNRTHIIEYDWDKKIAVTRYGKKVNRIAITPGYLDPLSFQLQMELDLRVGKKQLEYDLIGKTAPKNYKYRIVGEEKLVLDSVSYDTLKVERFYETPSSRAIALWVDLKQNHMMLKLVQSKNDKPNVTIMYKRVLVAE